MFCFVACIYFQLNVFPIGCLIGVSILLTITTGGGGGGRGGEGGVREGKVRYVNGKVS